ncbi:hypothetical protein ACLOJK_032709 [Asimina triloba]
MCNLAAHCLRSRTGEMPCGQIAGGVAMENKPKKKRLKQLYGVAFQAKTQNRTTYYGFSMRKGCFWMSDDVGVKKP